MCAACIITLLYYCLSFLQCQVKDDFCEFFIGRAGESAKVGGGGDGDGGGTAAISSSSVTLEGFREYYRDVGVCEPYDSVFIPMMEVMRRGRPDARAPGWGGGR